ncbi:GNAT family N-acetyltransferase (plasmid) [Rhizobium ruizarguesonis]|uniref:GNAT family N-acetyltransferase n=2 Tax=Rhizobium ruizarguesonis TaxID=2081791 RepID=A0AB38HTW7_9HYPH|nr:GNAT family N-acetyltransferase [Rhizobium ruizarguesonis]TCA35463.1 GNAT family N-acetyltransferase [Rhizobium leguminosarum bv. viciae]TAZ92058.1 GNAT family N-acetyltransferase [Rhizobium ruizarguesonis]TBB42186.1 GNAT family N-acetyltransferase [Rhizobium ruizarguesonis]TBB59992.1 GNAT family N-acetyltransferase [Rhizobium ruizarguesonis]
MQPPTVSDGNEQEGKIMTNASAPKTTDIKVRRVSPEDAAAWRALYRGYAKFYKREMTDAILDQNWAWLHDPAHPLEGLVVVASDGELVGLANYRPQPKPLQGNYAGFLDDLFVNPGQRGRGVGRQLIEHLATIARERGWSSVRWITAADNATARRLYDDVAVATHWVTYELNP